MKAGADEGAGGRVKYLWEERTTFLYVDGVLGGGGGGGVRL